MLATTLLVLVLLCALLAGLILLMRKALLVITVHGESMAPTLRQGDRLLVLRRFLAGRLRKGQVVIVTVPGEQEGLSAVDSSAQGYYVKRVVALASASSEDVFVVGEQKKMKSWQLPAGHVFVCGDNRQGSVDSRVWGPLPLRNVAGVMLMQLSPVAGGLDLKAGQSARTEVAVPLDETLAKTKMLPVGTPAPAFTATTVRGENMDAG